MSDEGREDTSVLDGTCWLGRLIRRGGQMEVDLARDGVGWQGVGCNEKWLSEDL
jgi:hypothetical protein